MSSKVAGENKSPAHSRGERKLSQKIYFEHHRFNKLNFRRTMFPCSLASQAHIVTFGGARRCEASATKVDEYLCLFDILYAIKLSFVVAKNFDHFLITCVDQNTSVISRL